MFPTGDTSQLQRYTQTMSERVQNDTPSRWHSEKNRYNFFFKKRQQETKMDNL